LTILLPIILLDADVIKITMHEFWNMLSSYEGFEYEFKIKD